MLATGSGDNTCRIWDLDTETPKYTLKGHTGWLLCVEWDGLERIVATGSMDNTVRRFAALVEEQGLILGVDSTLGSENWNLHWRAVARTSEMDHVASVGTSPLVSRSPSRSYDVH